MGFRGSILHPAGQAIVLFLFFFGGISPLAASVVEPLIEISVEIDLFPHPLDGRNIDSPRKFTSTCIISSNQWFITSTFVRGGVETWSFDGTNVFHTLRPTDSGQAPAEKIGGRSPFARVPSDRARSNLTINVYASPGGHPFAHVGANIPWLAFCSGPYLKRPGRVVPPPTANLFHAPDAFAYSDRLETFDSFPFLPRKLDLLTSREHFEKSVLSATFRGKRDLNLWRPAISRFPDGLLKFHYAVTATTNLMGWTLPTYFEFIRRDENEGNLVPRTSGTGKVIRIAPAAQLPSPFDPNLQQTVVDWRFRLASPNDALIYQSTNSLLYPTNHPFLQELVLRKLETFSDR